MSVSADTIGGVTQLQDTIVSDSSGSSTTRNHETLTTPSLRAYSDHDIPTWSKIVIFAIIIFFCAVIAIGACIYYCKKQSKSLISVVNSVQCAIFLFITCSI